MKANERRAPHEFHPTREAAAMMATTPMSQRLRSFVWLRVAKPALMALALAATPAASAGNCDSPHWVSAWQAPPGDAITPADANAQLVLSAGRQTFRSIIAPTGHGDVVRIHLSNRYGRSPVTFTAVSIARQTQGAAIDASSLRPVLFSGQPSLTLAAGTDAVSDPLAFEFSAFEHLAISVATKKAPLIPTHHFAAWQTSYASLPGAGDLTGEASATAFKQSFNLRPFVVGIDTQANAGYSAVVTLGDSITDGVQGIPSPQSGLDLDQRYPDHLYRRLSAAGRTVFVSNAGIGGNRVLVATPGFGGSTSALERLDADVIQQAGVSDVILLEGINDIANDRQSVDATVTGLINGYTQLIDRLHASGLRVIQATVLPSGAAKNPKYASAAINAARMRLNEWIRTQSPADAVVDFDAALRDPADATRLAAEFDGGDGLHPNGKGYEVMASTVAIEQIRGTACD